MAAGGVGGRENEPVEHLYVILEGEFSWSKMVDGGEVVMDTYGPGAFFAEVPLLARQAIPRHVAGAGRLQGLRVA